MGFLYRNKKVFFLEFVGDLATVPETKISLTFYSGTKSPKIYQAAFGTRYYLKNEKVVPGTKCSLEDFWAFCTGVKSYFP
jgi:hypothetical protein